MNILCKIFGHRITGLETKRFYAYCKRCEKGLKVSYDYSYGETVVVGDYGEQKTFCWCANCDNELCSSGSHTGMSADGLENYKCTICGKESKWDFDTPVPLFLSMK